MFCSKCGTQNDDNGKFCMSCGAPLIGAAPVPMPMPGPGSAPIPMPGQGPAPMPAPGPGSAPIPMPGQGPAPMPMRGPVPAPQMNMNVPPADQKKKPPVWLFILIGVAALTFIFIAVAVTFYFTGTIKLDNYIKAEQEGYDGYGTVSVSVDWDAVGEKSKIICGPKAIKQYGLSVFKMSAADILSKHVFIDIADADMLSNGDKVKYTWDIDKGYVLNRMKYSDGTVKVDGLKNVVTFDAFYGLDVLFSGQEPDGIAEIEYTGSDLKYGDFFLVRSSGLSNGDTVTVKIEPGAVENLVKKTGKAPEKMEKEFAVQGLYGESSGDLWDVADEWSWDDPSPYDYDANSDYMLPGSDVYELSEWDLYGFTAEQCKIARNEIYARHGRKFRDADLQAYFDSKSWYIGYIDPDDFQESYLSDVEIYNRDLIRKYEDDHGYN